MKVTDGELIQIQSQAEFMAMGFGTREWKLMAEAIKELRERRAKEVAHIDTSQCDVCGTQIKENGDCHGCPPI